jgi:hypothetical protein
MTSFSIDEHSSMNNTIPNLTSADTTPQISNTLPPIILPQSATTIATKVNNDNNTSTNNDDNETEISDTNTQNNSSPIKEKDSKERDDLKEKLKAEKKAAKKLMKELAICKVILEEMEVSASILGTRTLTNSNLCFRYMRTPGPSYFQ